jgi:membrane protease YdiL (CAAX protease family)
MWLDLEVVSIFMVEVYSSAGSPPLLWLALIVAAPLTEEFVFRGFLYQGLINTRLRFAGTAIVTSLLFASLHLQYDLYGISSIFFVGLLLCYVRHKSQSVLTCVLAHGITNLVGTIQVAYVIANS